MSAVLTNAIDKYDMHVKKLVNFIVASHGLCGSARKYVFHLVILARYITLMAAAETDTRV